MASAATTEDLTHTTHGPFAPRGGRGRGGRGRGGHAARSRSRGAPLAVGRAMREGRRKSRDGERRGDRSAQIPSSARTGAATESVLRVGQSAPPQAAGAAAEATGGDDSASDPEAPLCSICADPIRYSAVSPCNHSTCHICSLRMRALYKSKLCTHCRARLPPPLPPLRGEFWLISRLDRVRVCRIHQTRRKAF